MDEQLSLGRADPVPHTPAPWRATHTPVGWRIAGPNPRAAESPIEWLIARIVSDNPEDEANARLIVEAPALLAACKALLNAPHQEHFATRLNDEELAALAAIRVAVARAEGRT